MKTRRRISREKERQGRKKGEKQKENLL